jgi:hypothetical protein
VAVERRRRRREGSVVYSKSDGTWIACTSLGVVDGKRIYVRVVPENQREAVALLNRRTGA